MKRIIIITMIFGLAAGVLQADDVITLQDFEIRPDGTQQTVLNLSTEVDNYAGFQADIVLPIGFVISGMENAGRIVDASNVNKTVGNTKIRSVAGIEMAVQTVLMATTSTFKTGDEALATLSLTVEASMTAGIYTGYLQNITLSRSGGSTVNLPDQTFTITVYEGNLRVTLDENSTSALDAAASADVTVKRTIAADEWSTICLPFAMTEAQMKNAFGNDVQLADFTGYDAEENVDGDVINITVHFEGVTAIEANHPYIIKVSSPVSKFTVEGVDIDPEEEPTKAAVKRTKKQWSEMIGTYTAGTTIESEMLFLSGNKFWYSVGNTKMKAFRAYFDFYDVLAEMENANVKMMVNIGDETGIVPRSVLPNGESAVLYDIQGRRVEKTGNGIYIINNKKVLVR